MLSPRNNRFGIPGVISVIALVFALFGGAYAASNDSGSGPEASASAKAKKAKKGPRGPRGPKGPAGAAGAQGPAGPAGAKGDTGAAGANGKDGANGANGANGKTVLSGTATPTVAEGTLGDFYIETDVSKIYGPKASSGANGGWGTGTDLKGKEGSPWTAGGTLPVGKTETGSWGVSGPGVAPVSFAIPLAAELDKAHTKIVKIEETPPTQCENEEHAGAAGPSNPEAQSGFLCIYTAKFSGVSPFLSWQAGSSAGLEGASVSGSVLLITEPGLSLGTWAVTG